MVESGRIPVVTTGAKGLIGSRVKECASDRLEFLKDLDILTGVDITDLASVRQALQEAKGKTLIHFAAFTDVKAAAAQQGDENGKCYQVNVIGTRNVAQVCAELGIHMVDVSTDFVFKGEKGVIYTEESARNPGEWYGKTKAMAEEEIEKMPGLSYTIIRIAFPYMSHGLDGRDLAGKVQTALRAAVKNGSTISRIEESDIRPTFADDIAEALVKIVREKPQGIFHIVGSTVLSPFQFAREVAWHMGLDPNIVQEGTVDDFKELLRREGRKGEYPLYLNLSGQKAARLGIRMRTVDEGLDEVFQQQEESTKV